MFGKNEIVGRKYFNDNGEYEGKLDVTSIFFTIQGEGPFSGCPAVFIRLAKCNLACNFCDTYFDNGTKMSYEDIWKEIANVMDSSWLDTDDVILVITGGEPTLQKNLLEFLGLVGKYFDGIQIESNGILHLDWPDDVTLVISPKCSTKTGEYIKPNKKNMERADCLKFVVTADKESPYHTVPKWAEEVGAPIYVSPMNIYNRLPKKAKEDKDLGSLSVRERSEKDEVISFWEPGLLNMEENEANHKWAAELAMAYNYRLQLQVHLYVGLA